MDLDLPGQTFGYAPADPDTGQEAIFTSAAEARPADAEPDEPGLLTGLARRSRPGDFPPGYWHSS
ncbi:hypothetical protein ACFWAP_34925 [Streptomyces goshikiensis]|uniref:hypothetical protein n=1 Tax=Streptomyces goshikiensis TaxID=1942 RepID=UPI00364AAA28